MIVAVDFCVFSPVVASVSPSGLHHFMTAFALLTMQGCAAPTTKILMRYKQQQVMIAWSTPADYGRKKLRSLSVSSGNHGNSFTGLRKSVFDFTSS